MNRRVPVLLHRLALITSEATIVVEVDEAAVASCISIVFHYTPSVVNEVLWHGLEEERMKRIGVVSVLAAAVLSSCVSVGSDLGDYFLLHGATLEKGPMGFVLTAPDENSLALRRVDAYSEEMRCEFSLQGVEDSDVQNGFLLLADDQGSTIVVGVYIGAKEYVIESTAVCEPIRVPADFDPTQVFNFSVLVDFRRGFVEVKTNEREIRASLVPHMKHVDRVGYHAKSTRTHFSEITIVGK